MKALVLGATGHIGQGVVRELLGCNYRVTAATRRSDPASLRGLRVEVLTGDLDTPGQLSEWIPGHDIVVDAAAPKPLGYFWPVRGDRDAIGTARRRGRELIRAVERSGARLAFVSSFCTLPRPESAPLDWSARWRRETNMYFRVKAEIERLLLDAGRAGLPIVIANPTAVLGPWETCPPEESLVARVLAGRLPWVMNHMVNVIDVRDLAAAIRGALEAERYGEKTPMSGHDITLDDLTRRIATLAGVPLPTPIDAGFAVAAGIWMEGISALLGRPAPTAVCAVPVVADAWPMGTSPCLRALGVEPRPLEETLADSVRWRAPSA